MRASVPSVDVEIIAAQLRAAPGLDDDRFDTETAIAILEAASAFAARHLVTLNAAMDVQGCHVENGRVHTAAGHRAAWEAFVAAGWPTLEQPVAQGGQGLSTALAFAVQEIFDRACPAFGMLPVPLRAASRLLATFAEPAMREEWLPRLVSGEWGATICISEAEAGSDAGRIRTRAEPNGDGTWSITGEKCWISYGDHDLTPRIGHCLLARTPNAAPGGAGLSLFLVPDTFLDADRQSYRNAIVVRRIEEKLGLHGSPTCALGFEGATGRMIGAEGRGLAQMFVMITNMRLSVGMQGVGIAGGCADLARRYAAERRQGSVAGPPPPIDRHADVQRMLLGMVARVEVSRGLVLAIANQSDIVASDTTADAKADASALLQWLLPIVKTNGGECGFEVASTAIQVLGGAGYTKDWPAEQALRDARVLTIFEGTSGMQALDLLHRRLLRGDGRGLAAFLAAAHQASASCPDNERRSFDQCLALLEDASAWLRAQTSVRDTEAGADAYLHLASLAATGWIAARLADVASETPSGTYLRVAGRTWLSDIGARATLLHAQSTAGAGRLDLIRMLQ